MINQTEAAIMFTSRAHLKALDLVRDEIPHLRTLVMLDDADEVIRLNAMQALCRQPVGEEARRVCAERIWDRAWRTKSEERVAAEIFRRFGA